MPAPPLRPLAVVVLALSACSRPSGAPDAGNAPPLPPVVTRAAARIPPLAAAVESTDVRALRPTHAREPLAGKSPRDPAVRDALLAAGFGAVAPGPGDPPVTRWPPGVRPRPPGAHRRRVLRIAQLSDAHIVDDESPARSVDFDDAATSQGAWRPQEAYACRVLDAAVRT